MRPLSPELGSTAELENTERVKNKLISDMSAGRMVAVNRMGSPQTTLAAQFAAHLQVGKSVRIQMIGTVESLDGPSLLAATTCQGLVHAPPEAFKPFRPFY